MDPLSLTASILAILGTGGAIAKGLKNIGRLKEAPNILLQLNNEVTDLHLLIRGVDELYHKHFDSTKISQRQIVYSILNRAKEALLELEKLISYHWTKETDNGVEIDRTVWIRAQSKVQEMKDKIRSVRNDLNGAWMVISAKDESRRIELQVQQILVSTGHLLEGHSESHGLLSQSITFLSNQEQSLEVLRQRAQQTIHSTTPLPIGRWRNSTDTSSMVPHPIVDVTSSSSPLASPLLPAGCSNIFHIQLTRCHRCGPTCACSCHRKSFHKTPHLFKSVLGSLFVGYVGFPTSRKPCDTSICQTYLRRELQFLYVFPSWLLNWAVSTTMAFTKTRGPELILRCLRVRSRWSPIFQSVLQRDSSIHTMNLIATGEGSVLDIDEYGNSIILHVLKIIWRRQMGLQSNSYRFELLRNLISEGADVFFENDLMESPYMFAWRYRLIKSAPENDSEVIDELLSTADPVEMMGFNVLHSSIAGPRASRVAFETQLQQSSREMVNARDKVGRTALSWAGELGNLEIIEKLLHKGADPNIADNWGYTPLFYCAPRTELLRSLLRAGATVNHMGRDGKTKLGLLVRGTDNPGLMEELWKFGANMHLREPGQDWTLLHIAIAYAKPQIVRWVLQKGANIEALQNDGETPLLTAIWASVDPVVLELLLDMSADYKILDRKKEGVLHYIARHGNFGSMSLLQKECLSDLNLHRKSIHGYNQHRPYSGSVTAMDIAEQRRKRNAEWAMDNLEPPDPDPEAWFAAFQAFIDSIRAAGIAEQFGDFWGSLDEADPVEHVAEHMDTDLDYLPRIPGAYINE